MLKANRLQVTKRPFNPIAKRIIATLLVAMVLLLDAMVVSPALHELAHKDAGQASHQCVVTLFAHGLVDSAPGEISVVAPIVPVEAIPQLLVSVYSPAIEHLPAGRAPPVSPAPLV